MADKAKTHLPKPGVVLGFSYRRAICGTLVPSESIVSGVQPSCKRCRKHVTRKRERPGHRYG
jgi:hypothetical protein